MINWVNIHWYRCYELKTVCLGKSRGLSRDDAYSASRQNLQPKKIVINEENRCPVFANLGETEGC